MEEDSSNLPKSRKEAKEVGSKFYFNANPCKYGHVTKRYTGDGRCHGCAFKGTVEKQKRVKADAIKRGLERYFTGVPCRKGHLSERYTKNGMCVQCNNNYLNNLSQDKRREYYETYYAKNRETVIAKTKEYADNNKDKLLEYKKWYYQENKEKVRKYSRDKYAHDPYFKTSEICRTLLKRVVQTAGLTKNSKTYKILGYDNEDLKSSMESKFSDGMSWNNYGDWQIDHMYPTSRYIKDGVSDPAVINSLDNLLPMWKSHNREKDTRTLEEYLEIRPDLFELYGSFISRESHARP